MASKYRSISITSLALGLATFAVYTSKVSAAAPATPQGVATVREYDGIGGVALSVLTGDPRYPNNPDSVSYTPYLEWPTTADGTKPPGDIKNNYGWTITGYVYPPAAGAYTFYIAADDNAELYLSTDDNPANKKLIAREPEWNPVRAFASETRRQKVDVGSANERNNNASAPITLAKGKPYWFQALAKEGGGGDNLAVAWTTGGAAINDDDAPIGGEFLSSDDKASGPVTFTTQPQSQTIIEGGQLTLSVVVDGTPGYTYQWKKNGTAIADATKSVLTMRAKASDAGAYTVDVTSPLGTKTSAVATVTTTSDTVKPTVSKVNVVGSLDTVVVAFSEILDKASAETKGNYSLTGGVTVNSASLSADGKVVTLKTSKQTAGGELELTVTNVKDDSAAGNAVAAGTKAKFKTQVLTKGFVTDERYNIDPPSGEVFDGTLQQKVWTGEHVPSEVSVDAGFETPSNVGSNFFKRLYGFFLPPTSGNYVFYMASDDHGALYLSTDDTPAKSVQIATEPQWAGIRQWVTLDRRNPDAPENISAPIALQAGKQYYMEMYFREGGGGDNGAVLARKESDPIPAAGAPPISGSWIATYTDPNGQELEITKQPASASILENRAVTLAVEITTNAKIVAYQWKKNGVDIAGATTASYTTPKLQLADTGAKYSVEVTIAGVVKSSSEAVITVNKDTVPPKILSANALKREKSNTQEVTVAFDEDVNATDAAAAANFSIAPGTITKVSHIARSSSTVLTVTGLADGASYTVTAKNIKDSFGNALTSATASSKPRAINWANVGGTSLGFEPAVASVGDNGFDVYSGGSAFWASYDETTFVYEKVSGDFDKKVRVQYQDNSSQWARAGLMVREVLNEGQASDDTSVPFSRYQHVHVNPVVTAMGTPGNNAHELNQRLTPGSASTSPGPTSQAAPQYPNAWLRLKRIGQEFQMFRSNNGVDWIQIGSQRYPDNFGAATADNTPVPPFPAVLHVGPNYGPEMANNPADPEGFRFLGKVEFRDYGDVTSGPISLGALAIKVEGQGVVVSWTGAGKLQVADNVSGPYTDVTGATSPRTITPENGKSKFYRLTQ